MRKLPLLLLVTGVSLVLAAGSIVLHRMQEPAPPAAATQALMDATPVPDALPEDAVEATVAPASHDAPDDAPPPEARHGVEGLGGSGSFACAVEAGVRRCRSSD